MAQNVGLFVSGSTLFVSGNLGTGANMRIDVPLTVLSITSSVVVISSSIITQSGSTKWGDTNDDVHSFTGSIRVNGGISGTLTGTVFGAMVGTEGLTGSLQRLVSGQSYLVGGAHITITTASNGQVIVSGEGVADVSGSYVVLGNTGSLPNERALVAGTGILLFDGGPGSIVSASIDNTKVATISGSTFSGPVVAAGGLSGSLQKLDTGLSYLVADGHISITTQSNGQVVISGEGVADVSASYVVLGLTGSLPNERSLSASFGLLLQDNGAGGTVALRVNDNDVATLSGSTFRGALFASGGLTGSLQFAQAGVPYLQASTGIQLQTQSNGSVLVTAATGTVANNTIQVQNNVEFYIFSGTGGAVQALLGDHPVIWQRHMFKDADGLSLNNPITITPAAGFRIDNVPSLVISSSYGWRGIVYVGGNLWSIVGSGTGS